MQNRRDAWADPLLNALAGIFKFMSYEPDERLTRFFREWKDTFVLSRNPLPPPLWIAERAMVDAKTVYENTNLELLDRIRNAKSKTAN